MSKQAKKRKEMYSEVVTYTPALALEILERADPNRAICQRMVDNFVAIMKRGGWRSDTGESIKFDTQGRLRDGQHRLWAVVNSGVTVKMYTTFNIADDCFDTLDTGKVRKGSDILSILGEKNYALLSGTLTMCYRHEMGAITSSKMPDNDMYEGLLERHPGVRDSVEYILTTSRTVRGQKGLFPYSIAAFLHYRFAKKDKALADRFFLQLFTGEELKRTDAIWKLRDRCVSDMVSTKKMPRLYKAALAIKTWNTCRNGGAIGTLKWGEKEDFPAIK